MTELQQFRAVLSQPLHTDAPHALSGQLVEAEALCARVSELYRDAEAKLDVARNKYLMPKSKELTELDRTTQLDAAVAPEHRAAKELQDIADILQRRISLGQTLLKSMQTEQKAGLR